MRKTLEDFYYGNISPGAQQMAPNSELKRAVDRVTHFENQLAEQLDEAGQTVLANLSSAACRKCCPQRTFVKGKFERNQQIFLPYR